MPLIKWNVNFCDVNFHFLAPDCKVSVADYTFNFAPTVIIISCGQQEESAVCSQHSFRLPLKINGMHVTQFDHVSLDLLSPII